jgi:hypothetical protein
MKQHRAGGKREHDTHDDDLGTEVPLRTEQNNDRLNDKLAGRDQASPTTESEEQFAETNGRDWKGKDSKHVSRSL